MSITLKPGSYTKAWDIEAYIYRADIYCPACTLKRLEVMTNRIVNLQGFFFGTLYGETTEDTLTRIAKAYRIDREDERTFDSGVFPKVVFADQLEGTENCGQCGVEL